MTGKAALSGDPSGLGLIDAARLIATRKLSSEEATRAAIARIESIGVRLGAVAGHDGDQAIAAARAADARLAKGGTMGPLDGVPLAHKDMFYRPGRVSACGSRIRADFVPKIMAAVLDRLDRAGALDIARLAMVEFALGVTGHNEVTGTPGNPWNPDHVTGGSSSGSGVAVAARMVAGALGSDTGGSIRFPAACCGVVGMKPTYGRVSRFGAMPLSFSLDTVGPLTRTVADNAFLLRLVAGFDARDPATSRLSVPDYLATIEMGAKGLRLGVPENHFFEPVVDEVRTLIGGAIETFRTLGAVIRPVRAPKSVAALNGMTSMITATEGAALHARWMRERPQDYGRQTLGRLAAGVMTPATTYIDAIAERPRLLSEFMETAFADADLLIVPVMIVPVPTIAEADMAANPGFSEHIVRMGHATRPINYLGLPGLSVPCGFTANGLPCSFQLVGRPFDEATLYRAARAYERETGCTNRAPDLASIC
jgi:aspartyl-tRNA(Asn)/glutamyl-tRNA(Gln) amidotransferase subunit A